MSRIGMVLVLTSGVLIEGSNGGVGGLATPNAAFEKLTAAAKKDDMRGIMSVMTKESRKIFIGGMIAQAAMRVEFAPLSGQDTKELEAILTKHGIASAKVMENLKEFTGDRKKAIQGVCALAAAVKDGPAFVVEINVAMKKNAKSNHMSFAEDFKEAKVSDLKVDGKRARGKLDLGGKVEEIHFAQEDGGWKVDIVATFGADMKRK